MVFGYKLVAAILCGTSSENGIQSMESGTASEIFASRFDYFPLWTLCYILNKASPSEYFSGQSAVLRFQDNGTF